MSIDQPWFDEGDRTILQGDNRAALAEIADGTFDNVVSDPPYGLGFMGKEWDADVPSVELWRDVRRVCKPGAMALIFAGSRTYPFMALNLIKAGWELRDCLMWLYGTGFPKSFDVSKGIDKLLGAQREQVRSVPRLQSEHDTGTFCGKLETRPWMEKAAAQGFYEHDGPTPASEQASAFDGYGTALKPAWEPILLLMNPMEGSFAENALEHNVAGLNIHACRIGTGRRFNPPSGADPASVTNIGQSLASDPTYVGKTVDGRWPANVLLDEESAAMLDAQSGESKSRKGDGVKRPANGLPDAFGAQGLPTGGTTSYEDTGGASRFFYVVKPTDSDKGYYNIHPTVKPTRLMEYLLKLVGTPTGGITLDPFMGSGTTLVAAKKLNRMCVGMERDISYCEVARRRLQEIK